MGINKNRLDSKVQSYLDNLFSGVGETQPLFDLKEELSTNIKEKVTDYKSRGMEEDQAFNEAIISMGDLTGLVEDMRRLGQDTAKQQVYSSMTARISMAGIVAGVLLILFGIFTSTMLYLKGEPNEGVLGTGIFIVAGGMLLTYSLLTRETRKRYAMNKIRAALYAGSIGLILFGLFVALMSGFSTGEAYVAVASLMLFFLAGTGLYLFLILTGTERRKK